MMATAVNVFVIEPIRYWCSRVAASPSSAFARPTASAQITSPSRTTAAEILGARSAWASRIFRERSFPSWSGAGKSPQGLGDELDRAVDLVVADAQMRHGAEHAEVGDREPDPDVPEPLQRVRLGETERLEAHLNEVGLDRRGIDGHAAFVQPLRQPSRAGVVVGEPLDVVVERVEPGRSDNPRLAHGAA